MLLEFHRTSHSFLKPGGVSRLAVSCCVFVGIRGKRLYPQGLNLSAYVCISGIPHPSSLGDSSRHVVSMSSMIHLSRLCRDSTHNLLVVLVMCLVFSVCCSRDRAEHHDALFLMLPAAPRMRTGVVLHR